MAGGIDGDCRGERRARCAGEERRCDREGSGACPEVHVASSEAGCLRMRRLRIGNILDRRVRASIATEAETMSLPCDERARSEEHTSELQSLMRNSYAVFCLKKKKHNRHNHK